MRKSTNVLETGNIQLLLLFKLKILASVRSTQCDGKSARISHTQQRILSTNLFTSSAGSTYIWSVVKRDREDNHSGYLTSLR